ncbi:MAG: T9SS type A sorting domain-containing protein [Bacteroidetes bacterium]|nr:T9SS type A sorting domain-containing protein [Bacteroidota bacterium]
MKFITFLSLFLISVCSNAQIAWEHLYMGMNRALVNDIVHAPGNVFYASGQDTVNSEVRGFLAKLDSAGNLLWERIYTDQDSDIMFTNIIFIDSVLVLQTSSYSRVNGFYGVPKIITMDTSGNVLDSVYPDISSVYNSTGNRLIHEGANNTLWAITFIGTIGISNEIKVTQFDQDLDTLKNLHFGNYYQTYFSFNKQNELAYDQLIEEYDTATNLLSTPDHVYLYDSAGNKFFDSTYFDLPASKSIFRTDDGGFKLIYQQTDSMVIRQFDETGVLQRTRYYSPMVAPYYPAEAASDSGYFLVTVEYDFQLNRKKHIVIKCNNTDDTLWTQTFYRPYANTFKNLNATDDGGAIVVFNSELANDTVSYLVRLGPNGERFPYSLQINLSVYCQGDTVTLSTMQSASSYIWNTGDTTEQLHVTTSGNYSVILTDSLGQSYSVHSVPLTFDTIPQFAINDLHTCLSFVNLTQPISGITTYWSNDPNGITSGPSKSYSRTTLPDTLSIWVMVQTANGCRYSDSAMIYFDDCTNISGPSGKSEELVVSVLQNSFYLKTSTGKTISEVILSDLTGKILKQITCSEIFVEIDTNSLPAGVYILRSKIKNEWINIKVTKSY